MPSRSNSGIVQIQPASFAVAVVAGRRPYSAMSTGTRSATALSLGRWFWNEMNGSLSAWATSRLRKPVQSTKRSPWTSPCSRVRTWSIAPWSFSATSTTSSRTCLTPRAVPKRVRNFDSSVASKWYAYGNCVFCSVRVVRYSSPRSKVLSKSEPSK